MSDFIERYKLAEKAVSEANRDYATKLKAAEKAIKAAEAARDSKIKGLEKEAALVEKDYLKKLGSFGSMTLYQDRIKKGSTELPLDNSITATVDTGGNIYTTTTTKTKGGVGVSVGGALVGGVVAGPLGAVVGGKKNKVKTETKNVVHDKRTLFLTVTSEAGQISESGKPDKEAEARRFSDLIVNTAAIVDSAKEQRDMKLAELSQKLELAKSDTQGIQDAKRAYAETESDKTVISQAENRLEEVRESGTPEEIKTLEEHAEKQKKSSNRIATVVVVTAIVLFALIAVGVTVWLIN